MILRKTKKSRKAISKEQGKTKLPTTQNTLGYQYLFQEGLMNVVDDVYSNTYKLLPTTYSTLDEEGQKNILSKYNSAINQLSENEHFQLTLKVEKMPKGEYMDSTGFKSIDSPNEKTKPVIDQLVKELNTLIEERYDDGRNNFKVSRYITLSTHAENQRTAHRQLENIGDTFSEEMRELKSGLVKLDGMERLNLLNSILRPRKPIYGDFEDIARSNRTTHDMIAPALLDFKSPTKADFQIDDNYGSVLFLRDFPRNLSDQMFKSLTEAEIEMVITIHATSASIAQTNKSLRDEATDIEADVIKREMKASSRGYNTQHIARTTKELQKDVNEQIEFVAETGDKQQSSTFLIYTWASSKEERLKNINKIKSVGDKWGAVFDVCYLTQEEGLNSSLPLGKNYLDIERFYLRDLITPNISINSPFTSVDVQHSNGKYYGINELSKNNIVINRQKLLNANGGIMAVTGGGKSFAAKTEMITTFIKRPKDEIIIVDAEREYEVIGETLGGQTVHISPGSETSINVMELPNADELSKDDNPKAIKADFLVSLLGNLIGGLTPVQRSIVDAVTRKTYELYSNPTLQDWNEVLKNEPQEDARLLIGALDIYIHGSLNMFARKTNVDVDNRVTIYDMHNLKNEMSTFGYMVILDRIWQKVVSNNKKGITTWVYFDEFQIIMNPAQQESLRVQASDIYARIRKYNGIPTFMTQSAETMLSTYEGRTIMFNSAFLILLEQQGEVLDTIAQQLKLNTKQLGYLENPGVGKGLMKAGSNIIPFSNKIPDNTLLYKLMDTKPNE